jgi:hypothetical protein
MCYNCNYDKKNVMENDEKNKLNEYLCKCGRSKNPKYPNCFNCIKDDLKPCPKCNKKQIRNKYNECFDCRNNKT